MAGGTSGLLSQAFDPGIETPADAASEQILDAALALAAESGIRRLTMDDVAERAGVGRMTVYRRFGTKQRLVDALSIRECRRCLAELDAVDQPEASPAERAAEGFVTALRIAREHPLLNRLARLEPATVVRSLNADDGFLFGILRSYLAARVREVQEEGDGVRFDPDELAELLVRVGVSYVLFERSVVPMDDDEAVRELGRRIVTPFLVL